MAGDHTADAAGCQIESLMSAELDTPEGERLDILVTLIEACERQHFRLDLPDPVEAIRFQMEQKGLAPKDLEPMIGRSRRVYEILNRKRPLTLKMLWRLHRELGIPAESLIRPPDDAEHYGRACRWWQHTARSNLAGRGRATPGPRG